MTEDEVWAEVRSVFCKPMRGRSDFVFHYLQPTGAGSRSLSIPSVSASFSWSAQQVVKLAVSKQTIYILAEDDLAIPNEVSILNFLAINTESSYSIVCYLTLSRQQMAIAPPSPRLKKAQQLALHAEGIS